MTKTKKTTQQIILNINHGTRTERSAKTRSGSKNPQRRKVIGYSLTSTKVIIPQSMGQAEKFGFDSGNISKCCKGKSKSHKGYKWYYLDDIKNSKVSIKED